MEAPEATCRVLHRLLRRQGLGVLGNPQLVASALLADAGHTAEWATVVAQAGQSEYIHQLVEFAKSPPLPLHLEHWLVQQLAIGLGCSPSTAQQSLWVWWVALVALQAPPPSRWRGWPGWWQRLANAKFRPPGRFRPFRRRATCLNRHNALGQRTAMAAFVGYAALFVVFVSGLMGVLFGIVMGANLGFFLGLDMFSMIYIFAALFALGGVAAGLLGFVSDLRQQNARRQKH